MATANSATASGEYAGTLYDIGFDKPETHVVRKDGSMYYAFFAPEFNGKITLRGLSEGTYHVMDYVDGKDLGTVRGPAATLTVQFQKHLLLQAKPE